MTRIAALAGAAVLALSTAASAQPPAASEASALPTPAYVKAAARSDMFEMTEARMALRHTADPRIRDFANAMLKDHAQSTAMIKAALSRSGRPAPTPPALSPEQEQMVASLRASGPQFDRTYVDQQIKAHQQALQVHQGYAQGGDNPALRHAAEMIVPVVERHLTMIQAIQSHQS